MRAPTALEARIGKSGRTLCKVVDLSRYGARLETHSALRRGSTIWLTLPTIGTIAAEVRWSSDLSAGCEFSTALSPETFALLALGVSGTDG
ncbi:MAG: PilZ protein [Sphingomonas bacterium]|nr:PilZ protein [Sphingomonas bacterium]MDB5685282.1 PilZ protein [Sphingomonas bacterium]